MLFRSTFKANKRFGDYFCDGNATLTVASASIRNLSRKTSRKLRVLKFRVLHEGSGGSPPATTDQSAVLTPEEQCVKRWNEDKSGLRLGVLYVFIGETPYVSVGFSADYPDRCLITASNPDRDKAVQFLETRNGSFKQVGGLGNFLSSSHLDPSVTRWNASADRNGNVMLT